MLTVVTPATTFDLTTLATFKQEVGITVSTDDDKIKRLIHEASEICATFANRVFAEEVVAETLRNIWCQETISLERYPVSTISSIVEDGVTLTGTDYEVDKRTGLLYRLSSDCRIPWHAYKIVITYTAGYALLDSLPREIERACIVQVKAMFYGATRDPVVRSIDIPGVISKQYWVGGIGEDDGIVPEAADLLAHHRRIISW